MIPTQINTIIAAYARTNLSPLKPERDMIAQRYEQLQGFLEARTFQNGSYARHTSTTPVNDLDVFYVLPDSVRRLVVEARIKPEELTIENILQDIAKELRQEYGTEASIEVQPHSVGIFFGRKDEFSIDVVPAQPTDDGKYWVPETALRSVRARRELYESISPPALCWIKSDPKGYANQAIDLDDKTKGVFRKVAKVMKKWRVGCKDTEEEFALKSFHAEIILTELLKGNRSLGCIEALDRFFGLLPSALDGPQYADLADSSRYIDQYVSDLTDYAKGLVLREGERAAELVTQIRNAATEAGVIHGIEELLRISQKRPALSPLVANTPRTSPAYSKPYCS